MTRPRRSSLVKTALFSLRTQSQDLINLVRGLVHAAKSYARRD